MTNEKFQPIAGNVSPRFAGMPTFMRLPHVQIEETDEVDIGIIGVPWDGGTTNRPGPRHGPRQLRDLSTMIRTMHPVSRIDPFQLTNVADLGDSPINPVDVQDALKRITGFYDQVLSRDVLPMTAGGDHLVSLPVLRSLAKKHGAMGMIHFDAHTDLFDSYFDGFKYTHGTPFRRAIEEGCLDPKKVVQIGIRGTMYGTDDVDFAEEVGVRIIRIEELMDRGVEDVMNEARKIVGDSKTYISFDIDGIDPSQAPGTGTPEIGGFTSFQAQQMVRLLQGLNLVGADLVEVSPPFDSSGNTAWVGASMIFELLCVLADAVHSRKGK